MRHFVLHSIQEKRRLRRLSRRFGQLHAQVLKAEPSPALAKARANYSSLGFKLELKRAKKELGTRRNQSKPVPKAIQKSSLCPILPFKSL